jgi:23S rRNA G2445 N2-methylase RlmL
MLGDARGVRLPVRPTLIITNPPMGRRVLERDALDRLFRPFIARVAGELADGGRFVWISPLPERTLRVARAEGLVPKLGRTVDMGGFDAQIQVFVRPTRR